MSGDDFTKIGVRPEDLEDDAAYRQENYQVPTEITETDHRVSHQEEVLSTQRSFPVISQGRTPAGQRSEVK
jgi:hypothetical protein